MRVEIEVLHHRPNAIVIYVTHDQVEAMTMSDKSVMLNGGRIEQVGSPLKFHHRPANALIAGLIDAPR